MKRKEVKRRFKVRGKLGGKDDWREERFKARERFGGKGELKKERLQKRGRVENDVAIVDDIALCGMMTWSCVPTKILNLMAQY